MRGPHVRVGIVGHEGAACEYRVGHEAACEDGAGEVGGWRLVAVGSVVCGGWFARVQVDPKLLSLLARVIPSTPSTPPRPCMHAAGKRSRDSDRPRHHVPGP